MAGRRLRCATPALVERGIEEQRMLAGRYFLTILVMTVIGGLIGTLIGAIYGYGGHEPGWWGVGMLLGMIYGTISGFSMADRA